jgi:hypothetical protein
MPGVRSRRRAERDLLRRSAAELTQRLVSYCVLFVGIDRCYLGIRYTIPNAKCVPKRLPVRHVFPLASLMRSLRLSENVARNAVLYMC